MSMFIHSSAQHSSVCVVKQQVLMRNVSTCTAVSSVRAQRAPVIETNSSYSLCVTAALIQFGDPFDDYTSVHLNKFGQK